jgi:hypothetical protein
MTLLERSDLVLAVARLLYVNGQSTDQTLAAAGQLAGALELPATVMPRRPAFLSEAIDFWSLGAGLVSPGSAMIGVSYRSGIGRFRVCSGASLIGYCRDVTGFAGISGIRNFRDRPSPGEIPPLTNTLA